MTVPLLAPDAALFLDIDGTLIEFVPLPEDARVPPALLDIVAALQQALGGAVAVISGRALADIDRVFAPLTLAAAGDHGAVARLAQEGDGKVFVSPAVVPALAAARAEMAPYLAAHSAVRPDPKDYSMAYHYRGAESEGPELHAALVRAVERHNGALELLASTLCFDIRSPDANKRKATERFMAAAPFAGRVPVFIGDDLTDEDGFKAALDMGGRAIRVVHTERDSLATETFASPAELRRWLKESAQALRR